MSEATIPSAAAKAAAELLRRHKDDIPTDTRFSPLALADALDPPESLRDEAIQALSSMPKVAYDNVYAVAVGGWVRCFCSCHGDAS